MPRGGAPRNAIPLYDFPAHHITLNLVHEMPLRVSALRSLGAYANVFAIESLMDELAALSDSDPVEFRLRHLSDPRARAVIEADRWVPGSYTLVVDGTPQSHVNLEDPSQLFFEYIQRIGHVIDQLGLPGGPITAVHLGAGAFTLPRYIDATRPGSRQQVIELETDLVDLVRQNLPLPRNASIRVRHGDAAFHLDTANGTFSAPALVTSFIVDAGIRGVRVSHPDKPYWPEEGYTKLDLLRFYVEAFDRLRPYVADRLLSLERCPDGMRGQCFFQKDKPQGMPEGTPTQPIQHAKKVTNYVVGGRSRRSSRWRTSAASPSTCGAPGGRIPASPTGSASTWIRIRESSRTRWGPP